jgi:L-fuculose-phosphate aldolase
MAVDDLIIVDMKGRKVSGTRAPSSELRMHLAVYEERRDVKSVVHAHPTNCIALSIAGVSMAKCLLPEVLLTFGSIPTAAYTTPTTDEVPAEVRKWVRDFDALVLERHGSLTLGVDLDDAVDKLERMEHVAEITFKARLLGPLRPLSEDRIKKVQQAAQGLGLPVRKLIESPCEQCNACPSGAQDAVETDGRDVAEMIRLVTASVNKSIQGGGRGA